MASRTVEPAIGTLRCPVMLPVTEKLDPLYNSMKVRQANSVSTGDTPTRLGSGPPKYLSQYDSHLLHTLSLLSDLASVFASTTIRKLELPAARKTVSLLVDDRPENLLEQAEERQTKFCE